VESLIGLLPIIVVLGVWLALQSIVLPRLGVGT
jgi:hypothetical protein